MLGKGVLIDREGRTIALILCRSQAEEDTYVPKFCLIAGSPQFWNPIQGMYSQFGSCINPDMMSLKNSLEVWERAICTCPRGTPKAPCWCHETNPSFTRPIPKPCAQAWNLVVEAASLDLQRHIFAGLFAGICIGNDETFGLLGLRLRITCRSSLPSRPRSLFTGHDSVIRFLLFQPISNA